MTYIVPGMTLIPQKLNMSCWYASTEMLINWKQEQRQQSMAALIPPEYDAECAKLRDANNGIGNPAIIKMAKRIGLRTIPPMSPTPQALENWLTTYGPLWVNGISHIVVIAGIRLSSPGNYEVLVYDPWPPNVGGIDWRSLSSWYAMGTAPDSRDTGADVQTVFLYVPDDL